MSLGGEDVKEGGDLLGQSGYFNASFHHRAPTRKKHTKEKGKETQKVRGNPGKDVC